MVQITGKLTSISYSSGTQNPEINPKGNSVSKSNSSGKAGTDTSNAEPIKESSQLKVHDLTSTAMGSTSDSGVATSTEVTTANFDLLTDLLKKAQSQLSEMNKLSNES